MNYEKWLQMGKSKGIDDLEIFSERIRRLQLSIYQGKLDQHIESDVESVKIRGIYKKKQSTIRFESMDDDHVSMMLDQLKENATAISVEEPAIIFEGSPSYPEVPIEMFDFQAIDITQKIKLVKDLEATILASPDVKTVQSTAYHEIDSTTTLVNSKGLSLSRQNTFAYAYAIGVFEREGDIKTAYDIKLVKSFDAFDANAMAEETIRKGLAKLGGSSVPSKAYPVVFSNEMFSDILNVFTTIFSGESAYRNLTALKDKVGDVIAKDHITLIDDPLHPEAHFQTPFDDEGVACFPKHIVDKGVFKGFVHNLKTSKIFNLEPTGNGFSGGVRMTNFYLKPGDQSFDEVIKDIDEGIYITDLVGLHAGVKTVSGDFSLQAGGQRIKDGKLDHPVKMIVVSGNFFDVLKNVEAIGSDLKFNLSGVGSPCVKIKSLMIAGEA